MADNSRIEWTDATWNPITGCSVVSPGCTNCYAMRLAGTRLRHHPSREGLTDLSKAGPVWNGQVRFNWQWLDQPLRWRRPRRIFVCAHGDLFHENVPDDWIDRVFAVMALADRHNFQVLTKRPERAREYLTSIDDNNGGRMEGMRDALVEGNAQKIYAERTGEDPSLWLAVHLPLPNVWIGTSVEDQKRANERVPILLTMPAAVRFLSVEPLIGAIDLKEAAITGFENNLYGISQTALFLNGPLANIDWVIVGGESGPGARDMDPDWARLLRDQCHERDGTAFFMKQMARKAPIPDDLMIREYPKS